MSRVSGTNEVSDGNETNNPAEGSDGNETNNPAPVTEKPLHPHEPHIEILRGQPTDQELAALIAVLGSISGSTPPAQPEPTRGACRSTSCGTPSSVGSASHCKK
ncbi:Probable bifunctional protein acetyl-/propionyl-coenzyme A carboxylase (epsilon chain) AccE5 [Mycobacterium tuberculosis]|nr:Probable bifunctional protein acetyl-/propionyl-coenzyme A carboxylase (epsilon chain) AccE5 [Mycobacterium tuberculosis]